MAVWSKADIHLHTTCSNGFATPEALVNHIVAKTDLRVIAITDHDTIQGAVRAKHYLKQNSQYLNGLEIIVGTEITSTEGHILGLFVKQDVPAMMSAQKTIAAIHTQGGLAIAAHPYTHWLKQAGMEGVGNAIRHLPFDAVETRNATPTEIYANYFTQLINRHGQCLPETGGSDAHWLSMIGKTYTLFAGCTSADFRNALCFGRVKAKGFVCNPFTLLKHSINSKN